MKRINHFAWLVRRDNVAQYVSRLESLLGTEFEHIADDRDEAYVNWDSGLEFVVPVDTGGNGADRLTKVLEERGEGPYALVIRVPDLDAGAEQADASSFEVAGETTPPDREARRAFIGSYTKKVVDLREIHIGAFLGIKLALCEIEYAAESNRG